MKKFVICIGKWTVKALADEALKRYQRLMPSSHVPSRKEIVSEVRKTRGETNS